MPRTLEQHLAPQGRKRILALDGGGARGVLSLGILKRIETLLQDRLPLEQRAGFRLCHYYDLIGGTSTGSILAAGLATGMRVDDLRDLYFRLCPKIFKQSAQGINKPKFKGEVLAEEMRRVLRERNGQIVPHSVNPNAEVGEPILLGSQALRTGFAAFAKRINTGGAWTLTNHPDWTYYSKDSAARHGRVFKDQDNKDYSLAQIVRASAAAPTYFDTVGWDVESDDGDGRVANVEGVFVDGALSGRNTPALQMLFMVKHPAFGFNWALGEDRVLLTSIGTGWWRPKVTTQTLALQGLNRLVPEAWRAVQSLQTMIHDSSLTALQTLQSYSIEPRDSAKRWRIDGEVEKLEGFLLTDRPLLRFRRMDVRLERTELEALFQTDFDEVVRNRANIGLRTADYEAAAAWSEHAMVMRLRELAENHPTILQFLYDIGAAYANRFVDNDDFPVAFDPSDLGGSDDDPVGPAF
jgi:predicted acylesterase/phospholipase RssA